MLLLNSTLNALDKLLCLILKEHFKMILLKWQNYNNGNLSWVVVVCISSKMKYTFDT